MLGPMGSNIMAIFRLLSPEEIDKYLSVSTADNRVQRIEGQMCAGGEELSFSEDSPSRDPESYSKKFVEENKAKVIPIGEYQAKKEKRSDIEQTEEKKGSGAGLESIGVLSASTIKKVEAERMKKERASEDSTTLFLLKERQKMKNSKKKLIEQEAYRLYKDTLNQEFHQKDGEDSNPEVEENLDSKGILINKKHY